MPQQTFICVLMVQINVLDELRHIHIESCQFCYSSLSLLTVCRFGCTMSRNVIENRLVDFPRAPLIHVAAPGQTLSWPPRADKAIPLALLMSSSFWEVCRRGQGGDLADRAWPSRRGASSASRRRPPCDARTRRRQRPPRAPVQPPCPSLWSRRARVSWAVSQCDRCAARRGCLVVVVDLAQLARVGPSWGRGNGSGTIAYLFNLISNFASVAPCTSDRPPPNPRRPTPPGGRFRAANH